MLRGATRPIVLEFTAREPIVDYAAVREVIAALGVAVDWAVDEAGAGYASLPHIIELRPRYVTLDRGLVTGINADPIRQALVAGMLRFASSIGVEIIAEGVETEAERDTLQDLGAARTGLPVRETGAGESLTAAVRYQMLADVLPGGPAFDGRTARQDPCPLSETACTA